MRRGGAIRIVVLAIVATVACAPLPPPVDSVPSTEHVPVVIVPGWGLTCGEGGEWGRWTNAFVRRGYPRALVRTFRYDSCQPNLVTAEQLGRFVDDVLASSGAKQVDIVAHSMGALSSRWCLRFGGCVGKVHRLVTVAGASHGTIWANLCPLQFWHHGCPDMIPDGPFVTAVNAGPDPLAGVPTTTYQSWCDLAIVPFTGGELPGADNHSLLTCITHENWASDPAAIESITSWMATGAATASAASPPATAAPGAS